MTISGSRKMPASVIHYLVKFPLAAALMVVTVVLVEPALAEDKVKVVLVGDSTVASGSGWGNAFGKMLGPQAECFNEAAGGRSSKSYRDEGRWKKALERHPDWMIIQFGHNDQPGKGPERETDPKTTFPANLERYVEEAKAAGAKPILVTSLTRRNFENGKLVDSLRDYVEATRRVAKKEHVPLLDLNARSMEAAEKLGPEGLAEWEPAGKEPGTKDHTHLNERGGQAVAELVVGEVRQNASELAKLLAPAK
jgi:lysophospholipase L1-like esterase